MKILQVVQFFSPNHGGSAVAPYELSKQLQKRGHEITVLTTDYQMNNVFIDSLEGIEVIPFHCQLNVGELLISFSLDKYLEKNIKNFDIIHLHNYRTYQNVVTHKYAKKYKVPYILQARGSVLPFFQKQFLKKNFDMFFGYKLLKDASKVIALTEIEMEQYSTMGVNRNKIELIPNGIDLSKFNNLPCPGIFKKKYGIRDNEKVILYLGRIHKIKGIDLLVNAFADLTGELNDIKLVIAGPDDGYLSTIKKQIEELNIKDRVLFTGPLYNNSKLESYVDADVYILPSVYDTFPNTVLEAFSCGTPVIITDQCGIAATIDGAGCVVDLDKNHLKSAILQILNDNQLRKRYTTEGRKLVSREFSWDSVINRLEKLYNSVIEVRECKT